LAGIRLDSMRAEKRQRAIDPERWVERYGDKLYRYAFNRLRSPQLAEDKVQEAFLAAIQARLDYQSRASERTWLTSILKHKIFDHFRKVNRELCFSGMLCQETSMDHLHYRNGGWMGGLNEWSFDPTNALELKEFLHTFHCCLSEVPPRLAKVFILREVEGLGTREICNLMAISATNLSVMLHRSRMQLRDCLERRWFCEKACEPPVRT
jgi:RNA polymerase sigma-70 factor (ECF subfamily)